MLIKIFGTNVQIECSNKTIENILKPQIAVYPKSEKRVADVLIKIVEKINLGDQIWSSSPSIHQTFENGYLATYKNCKIHIIKKDVLEFHISINSNNRYRNKFLSMGYTYDYENIGQILHELIFVPMIFFDEDKAFIHASCMKSPQNKTVMFGGTGGVGKTSLELLLGRNLNYSFIADDIAVISKESKIFPNLSFPKIYGYNVQNNSKIKNLLFENSGLLNKLQWEFLLRFRGQSAVRRTISPEKIFANFEKMESTIDSYYILTKSNSIKNLIIKEINADKASELSLKIIQNEYHSVFQHIVWHEYNCQIMGYKPILKLHDLFERWSKIYFNIFRQANNYLLTIPPDLNHNEFLKQMEKEFENQ